MHAHVLIAICVLLTTATDGAHDHLFRRWLTRGQLPTPCQHAVAAAAADSRDEALPASALDTAWFQVADDKRNSVMHFVETKQELFLFGEAPAAPAPITTPGTTTDTSVASASTRATATSPFAPDTSKSVPATRTSAHATITSAPSTSTSAPATSTSAPTTGTSEPSNSSNGLLLSSTIPPGYTYYPATKSFYKPYNERTVTWHVANSTCAGEGAHVVVLNDSKEADVVMGIMRDAGYYDSFTGLRNNRPGGVIDWRTVHGEPLSDVFNEWGYGEPENQPRYTCATFGAYNKRLHDVSCDWPYYFTCEISV